MQYGHHLQHHTSENLTTNTALSCLVLVAAVFRVLVFSGCSVVRVFGVCAILALVCLRLLALRSLPCVCFVFSSRAEYS